MRPVDRDLILRPGIGTAAGVGRLTGQRRDELHRSAGWETGSGPVGDRRVPLGFEIGDAPPPLLAWRDRADVLDTEPARRLDAGHGSPTPRPGWYAYRVTGAAELPSWAVEIALTIERPAASTATGAQVMPAGTRRGERPLGSGSRGPLAPPRQAWVDDSLDPSTPAPELWPGGGPAQAMVLLRASGRLRWLDGVAEAVAEVETVAGIRPADHEDDLVEGDLVEGSGGRRGRRVLTGPVLPGLAPVTAAVARAHLRIAGSRGLPAPLRRRRPATGALELTWRTGAGCVLTCDGPDGRSAQAVVGLRGMGNAAAIAPPPGGALVLRAWRARVGCGVACGLVLGAPTTLGLGRHARQVAAVARSKGWDASVLVGSAAVRLARAGSPRRPAPRQVAQAATKAQVAALLQACLTAADSA
jgi:hypothetical protein